MRLAAVTTLGADKCLTLAQPAGRGQDVSTKNFIHPAWFRLSLDLRDSAWQQNWIPLTALPAAIDPPHGLAALALALEAFIIPGLEPDIVASGLANWAYSQTVDCHLARFNSLLPLLHEINGALARFLSVLFAELLGYFVDFPLQLGAFLNTQNSP